MCMIYRKHGQSKQRGVGHWYLLTVWRVSISTLILGQLLQGCTRLSRVESPSAHSADSGLATATTSDAAVSDRNNAESSAESTPDRLRLAMSAGSDLPAAAFDTDAEQADNSEDAAGVRSGEIQSASAERDARREVFPGIYVDLSARCVEFEGTIPIDASGATSPLVYLEAVGCIRDSKEHEALVMSSVRPSHLHAAMLLIGLHPGKPGGWDYENERLIARDATGEVVEVTLSFKDSNGTERAYRPQELITRVNGQERFGKRDGGNWVFAGSRVVTRHGKEWYDADASGILIGLATFGGEVIAWSKTFSPETGINEPEWIADRAAVPTSGTTVTVKITPIMK